MTFVFFSVRGWGKSSTTISYIIISSGDTNREKKKRNKQKIGAIVLYLTFHYINRKTGNSTIHSKGVGKSTFFFLNGERKKEKNGHSPIQSSGVRTYFPPFLSFLNNKYITRIKVLFDDDIYPTRPTPAGQPCSSFNISSASCCRLPHTALRPPPPP